MYSPSCCISPTFHFQRRLSYALLLVIAGANVAFSQTASLTLASGSAAPGGSASLNLSLNASTAPSSLQWTLPYNTSNVAGITVSAGPSVSGAAKTLICTSGSGNVQCMAYGLNANPISNGVVASVNVKLTSTVTSASVGINVSNGVAAFSTGKGVTASGTAGADSGSNSAIGGHIELACLHSHNLDGAWICELHRKPQRRCTIKRYDDHDIRQ